MIVKMVFYFTAAPTFGSLGQLYKVPLPIPGRKSLQILQNFVLFFYNHFALEQQLLIQDRVCLLFYDSEKGGGCGQIPSEKHHPLFCCEVTVDQFSDKTFHMNLMPL